MWAEILKFFSGTLTLHQLSKLWTPGNTCIWEEFNLIWRQWKEVAAWKWGCRSNPQQYKELASYSVENTVILVQEAVGTSSLWLLTLSEAECNHYRQVQYSLRHRDRFFSASFKLLPIISRPGEAPVADYPSRAFNPVSFGCLFA